MKLKETVSLLVTAKEHVAMRTLRKRPGFETRPFGGPPNGLAPFAPRPLLTEYRHVDTDASEPNFVSHTQSRLPTFITPSSIQRDI
jgi:hypothetical protein